MSQANYKKSFRKVIHKLFTIQSALNYKVRKGAG